MLVKTPGASVVVVVDSGTVVVLFAELVFTLETAAMVSPFVAKSFTM